MSPTAGSVPVFDAVALIDEERCIGCTLCIEACPVDAIVGAAKLMHTVIAGQCTGCQLCVPPCPVDCIAIHATGPRNADALARAEADALRRAEARLARLQRDREERSAALEQVRKKREVIARAVARARERLQKA